MLDLDGERAVLTVGQFDDDVDPALVEEARAVFDSIVVQTGRVNPTGGSARADPSRQWLKKMSRMPPSTAAAHTAKHP